MTAATRLRLLLVAAASLAGLWWSASGGWPPVAPATILPWYEEVGPALVAAAGLRVAAAAGCAWVLLASLLQVGAGLRPLGPLRAAADRLSPAVLRRLAGTAVAVSMSVGVAGPAGAGDGTGSPGTAVMVVLDEEQPASPAIPVPVSAPQAPAPAPAPRPAEVRVAPGDSFWRLAEVAVAHAQGAAPDEDDVARYWRRLVEANRERLVDPGNADLLLPGQVVALPEV